MTEKKTKGRPTDKARLKAMGFTCVEVRQIEGAKQLDAEFDGRVTRMRAYPGDDLFAIAQGWIDHIRSK